jgi:hypothetical protein
LTPFAWVTKRDGRLVPFEADKISRALFAATETLGRPDAFLARELTDGVLHFLATDADGVPTTDEIADTVIKVVRELGQPALSQAFAAGRRRGRGVAPAPALGPSLEELESWVEAGAAPEELARRAGARCLRAYALRQVFAPDVAAVHDDGLLTLGGLEAPFELEACALGPLSPVAETVRAGRSLAGHFVALDAPEHDLARQEIEPGDFARALTEGLQATGLRAVLNLNCAVPPPWAGELAEGPLFLPQANAPATARLNTLADILAAECLDARRAAGHLRIDWHLAEHDLADATASRLLRLARLAAEGAMLTFVFDRPRRPVVLAEGLDRTVPALLLTVGLNLARLLEHLTGPVGGPPDVALFLRKLGSLARLALSAGVQKRAFLRRHAPHRSRLARGFLLDRARLVLVPLGLNATARALLGRRPARPDASLDLARQIVEHLRELLLRDGGSCRLDARLDSSFALHAGPHAAGLADLTPADAAAPPREQLRAAGLLHAAAGAGTAALVVPLDQALDPSGLADLIHFAWRHTEIVRLRVASVGQPAVADLPFRDG